MSECDTLLMVGSSFPYSEWLPKPGQARGVQIDIDGRMLNIRYPMELGLVGDAKDTLQELLPLLRRKDDRSWRKQIEGEIADWWRLMEQRAHAGGRPDQPAASVLGAEQRAAGRRDHLVGLGVVGQLVRARRQARPRAQGVALRDARDDGPGRSVRDRGEVRLSRPAGAGACR